MIAVQQVFISSIQRGYEDVRVAVRGAVESLEMRPLMAELAGAHAESPQRALLDLVARCDVFLLIVGPRYSRPTEDEFDEANRLGKPILVLRQHGQLDPEQEAFLERVAGGWSGGRLWGMYEGPGDVALVAVRALTNVGGKGEDERRRHKRGRRRSLPPRQTGAVLAQPLALRSHRSSLGHYSTS
jgi:hypothetical protein